MAEKKVQKKTTKRKTAPKKQVELSAPVYDSAGKKTGTVKLPEAVFNARRNNDLIHQVVEAMRANARQPIAHAKDRSEKRGGGRKPWRQKGTGRARHGSRRSPIWIGGGVTHGPRNERKWERKINKKMKRTALNATLSQKYRDGEVLFVDELQLSAPKAAVAKEILELLAGIKGYEKLGEKTKNAALIALGPAADEKDEEKMDKIKRAFGNFGNVTVDEVRNLNPVSLLTYTYVIITNPDTSVAWLEHRGSKEEKNNPKPRAKQSVPSRSRASGQGKKLQANEAKS